MMKKLIVIIGIFLAGSALLYSQAILADKDIADAIENQFMFDHALNVNKVDIDVNNGITELTGKVSNIKAKERATRIAKLVKGVRAVSNQIEVKPSDYLNDDDIRDMVVDALLVDPATDLYEVEVTVDDGVVTLSGTVDSYQEAHLVADVAKSAKGVTGIENLIEIDYKTVRTDYEIQEEIEAALKWNLMIEDGLLNVKVNNGNVELTGSVGSAAEKTYATSTSWVAGVNSVDVTDVNVEWWLKDDQLRKNKNEMVSDVEIESAIIQAAIYDPRVSPFDIEAESKLSWVTLRGTVDNLSAKKAAEKLAENTYGVKGVTNRIKVKTMDLDDQDIQAKVNKALIENAITEAWEIGVFVHDGIATLSGEVDSYLEKAEATWLTSNIDGVNEVNNAIEVIYPSGYYWYGHYPYYDFNIYQPIEPVGIVPEDRWIETRVSQELWWSPYVNSDQVDIAVENGVVTLEGTVESYREYQEAALNAWEGGAHSVVNLLEVN